MKTPNTTTSSSTTKLLNKKLSVNLAQTPKLVDNKIYPINTTKQLKPNYPIQQSTMISNGKSMKKAIESKLQIIKQQISRQISQHYKKQLVKQTRSNRNISQLSTGINNNTNNTNNNTNNNKHSSRSRIKSQKNAMIYSASASRVKKSHSKIIQRCDYGYSECTNNNNITNFNNTNNLNNNNHPRQNPPYDQQQTLKPIRLFDTFLPDTKQPNDNETKVLTQSISKINYNHPKLQSSSKSIKKNKYLIQQDNSCIDDNNRKQLQHHHHIKASSTTAFQSYREKYLQLNQKYLNQKQAVLWVQDKLNKLKTSIEAFFVTPHEGTLVNMIEVMEVERGVKSGRKQQGCNSGRSNNTREVLQFYKGHTNNNSPQHHQQQLSQVEQTARYMLACYQDIQQFKNQLQHILQITSTSSLQQLKCFLQENHSKKSKNIIKNKQSTMPQSIDEYTFRFLQLEASNNRLREEYEKMIQDVREKGELTVQQIKRLQTKEKDKLKSQMIKKDKHYQTLLNQLQKLTSKYTTHLHQINSNHLLLHLDKVYEQQKVNDTMFQEKVFTQNRRKLSEFRVGDRYVCGNTSDNNDQSGDNIDSLEDLVQFTPKYNNKHESKKHSQTSNKNNNNNNSSLLYNNNNPKQQSLSQSIPMLTPPNRTSSISNKLPLSSIPQQLINLQQILYELVYQLGSIKFQAQQNMMKLGQANEGILLLDKKMYEIKYQLQEQVKEAELRVVEKQKVIGEKQLIIKQLLRKQQQQLNLHTSIQKQHDTQQQQSTQQILSLNIQLATLNQQLTQKDTTIRQLQSQLQQTKSQLVNTNKKAMELLQQSVKVSQVKKEIQLFVKEECDGFVRRIDVKSNQQGENISIVNNSKHFPTLPTLSTTLFNLFTSVTNTISTQIYKSTQNHKLYIQKQKQSFEQQQKLKSYQKQILSLEITLNNAILQKQQYEFLLTELRREFDEFKKYKQAQMKQMIDTKEKQLLTANRLILQQNSKLSTQLHQQQQQTTRINTLLEQKVNQRTFYRRKASQLQSSLEQKNTKILQLQKQCNKYRLHMQEIERSFADIVQSEEMSSKKITSLQSERMSVKEQVCRLVQVNKLLQQQNAKLTQQHNIARMQAQRIKKRLSQFAQSHQSYQKVNIQLRMKTIQLQQINQSLQQTIKKLSYELQSQKSRVYKLERENNSLLERQNGFVCQLGKKNEVVLQERKKYDGLWGVLKEKEKCIDGLMKEMRRFQDIIQSQQNEGQQSINIINSKQQQQLNQQQHLTRLNQQLSRLSSQLITRQQQLNRLQTEITTKQHTIDNKQNQLINKHETLTLNQAQLSIKQQKLLVRQQSLIQKQAQYEQNVMLLEKQRQLLNEKMGRLSEKLRVIGDMEREISVRYQQVRIDKDHQEHLEHCDGDQDQEQNIEQSFYVKILTPRQHQMLSSKQQQLQPQCQYQQPINNTQSLQQPHPLTQLLSNHPNLNQQQHISLHDHQPTTDDILQSPPNINQLMSPYIECLSEQMNANDMAFLHSQQKQDYLQKYVNDDGVKLQLQLQCCNRSNNLTDQQWVKQINMILTALITEQQAYSYSTSHNSNPQPSSKKLTQLPYYDSIKTNYNKILGRLLRQPTPLQLDLSQIQYKNSMSSSSSNMNNQNNKIFFGIRYNSSENEMTQQKQQQLHRQNNIGIDMIPRSNTGGHELQADISIMAYKLKVDHLSQLKSMLYQKVQQIQKQNIQLKKQLSSNQQSSMLKDKISQLQSKLYTYEDFANDEMKVGVLWNLFKQIICAYNEDDLEKFQRVCRILFKMLNYPQREIDQFNINWENRRKRNKISSFFTKWVREGSVEKREQSARKVTPSKTNKK